jgi:hypothetical protein
MRSMAVSVLSAMVVLVANLPDSARAATAQQVQEAIDRATKYVYSQMNGDNWELTQTKNPKLAGGSVLGQQWGGITAICTYALLAAGEDPQDPRIAKAIEFLRTADLTGTYAIGLRAQVWLNIPKNDLIRAAIRKDAKLLLLSRRTTGENAGEYTYFNAGPSGGTDHSNSQYGVLGMWACSDQVEVPETFWTQADQSWRQDQGPDGSWGYSAKPGTVDTKGKPVVGTANMTAAGLATLFITQDFRFRDRGLECSGNIVDPNIESGLKWMATHFKEALSGAGFGFYGLYGIERIGVASGYKYFGNIDWYKTGADFVLKLQKPDGSFPPINATNLTTKASVVNTCFALLFLARGSAPVMMNKLDYQIDGQEANWNERPRDAFNLVHWVGKETESTLNWQVSTIGSPVEDWHDAPILYMSGNQALHFTPEELAKLRTYVEEGGLILGSADCGNPLFAQSFRKLGTQLFKTYEFSPVGPSDVIMHNEQFNAVKWRRKPTLLGLSNGARYLMLLIPDADPAKAWQMEEMTGREELFQLGGNICLYAVDKTGAYVKGDTYIVTPDVRFKAVKTIDVARIEYEGNWNPEPGGWRRLSAVMHNRDSLDVNAVGVDPAKGSLAGKKIAHLTGTDRFRLTAPAIAALQQFIKDGGTLIVDAAGGDAGAGKGACADAEEKALQAIFGDDAQQLHDSLPADSPVYTTGGKLGDVKYRSFAKQTLGNLKSPRLRGITQNGRLVCIYSPEDLSLGLVGEPVDGIMGYSPETATELMRKILLVASGDTPVPPKIPAAPPKRTAPKPVVKKPTTVPLSKALDQ